MYKIIFSDKVYEAIEKYVDDYLGYYEELYKDSGIWSHDQIIESYVGESHLRYHEIADAIQEKLSDMIISYTENETIIRWRTKILIVNFSEKDNTRTVTDLDIR